MLEGDDGSKSYMMGKLESVQYSAALAVTRNWIGTMSFRKADCIFKIVFIVVKFEFAQPNPQLS